MTEDEIEIYIHGCARTFAEITADMMGREAGRKLTMRTVLMIKSEHKALGMLIEGIEEKYGKGQEKV